MRRWVAVAMVVSLAAAACADDSPAADGPASTTSTTTTTATTTEAPVEHSESGAIVAVRLRGTVAAVGDGPLRLCRFGGPVMCGESIELRDLAWDDVPVDPWEESWGRWHPERLVLTAFINADGTASVTTAEIESRLAPSAAACPDRTSDYPVVGDLSFSDVRTAIVNYTLTIGDRLAGETTFDAARGISIVRVVDDPAPHQAALDELVPGRTCVIQLVHSRNDLGTLRQRLSDLIPEWGERGYGEVTVKTPPDTNLVVVTASRIDARFWDDVGSDDAFVWAQAPIDVLGPDRVDVLDDVESAVIADIDRLVPACRNFPVDPAVFETPAEDHRDGHPSAIVFAQDMPGVPDAGDAVGWWRVYENEQRVLYVSEDSAALKVAARPEGWIWAGSGGCTLALIDPLGFMPWRWRVDPERDQSGDRLSLLVHSGVCPDTTADDLTRFVAESADAVTITLLRAPFPTDLRMCHTVDGFPTEFEFTVTLDAPLGDRDLFDGGQLPPRPVA